ncbi:30S ribosomal protein S19e [Candidatus Woesearchaeota archaeon]|nr:MAG: 30S ribosomal protein S19e [Candidatus Woesearchaeota archaeon]
MASIYEVDIQELVARTAEELKKASLVQPEEWAKYVKTGHFKEKPPVDPDWWYFRSASILIKVARKGPIGVSKLRTLYGGKKNRGNKPERFYKASGNIIRKVMQQLEKSGLLEASKSKKKGRVVSPKGMSFLDKLATELAKRRKPSIKTKESIEKKGIKEEIEKKKIIKKKEKNKLEAKMEKQSNEKEVKELNIKIKEDKTKGER